MSFFVRLWESIFEPGTSPQLIIATHVSFILLLVTLGSLIVITNYNIHFILLFIIASLLWITVIWFVNELKNIDLKSNSELQTNKGKAESEASPLTGEVTSGYSKDSTASHSTTSRKL
ncbi:hypothetical protein KAFR_0A00450 [Kazachstania africana CBS 2517]|uniref:V-type ATPase assembly factor PKR1 n=1 Tax=Kazachstania africana (strain ATCC 22294 / BCRC 22015 / CBS 2517 / CECT 1963 / NBRC 1671 / NRRL Y-8276) TaxID=1071382 RepID=H2AM83_KAZAF|nr:hypothetical protein KAFR_0A00450 [Kazachstania africana CBS 2517]CCF55483.1 hypothetical protein KAFR_0A00450 [Kazachstania africana CBS 2517]